MSGYRTATRDEADSLADFRYEPGDRFVRHPHYRDAVDTPDPAEWTVAKRRFVYAVRYLPDRDGTPAPAEHREYELTNRCFERVTVSEVDLQTEWEQVDAEATDD